LLRDVLDIPVTRGGSGPTDSGLLDAGTL